MVAKLSEVDVSAETLRETLWHSPVIAVVAVAKDGQLIAANATFLQTLGFASLQQAKGSSVRRELLADESAWDAWLQTMQTGRRTDAELCFAGSDGRHIYLRGSIEYVRLADGKANHFRGVFVDNTLSHTLDNMSFDAARSEATTSIAAGVAHDLNNLLTVLVGNLYLVSEQLRGNQGAYEKIKRARDAARRGASLTRALLNMARGSSNETANVQLPKLFDGLVPLLTAALGSRTELRTSIEADTPAVNTNPAQLESAVTNLIINARDALSDRDGGTVELTLMRRQLDPSAAAKHGVEPGPYVEIGVADNGPGMPTAVAERAFEPFFTTKGENKGSGLGLAMVRWFAEESAGSIDLETRPGTGTTVRILLPASQHESANESAAMTMPLSTLPGGSETVAVLSEDDDLKTTVNQILSAVGYTVVLRSMKTPIAATARECNAQVLVLDASALNPSSSAQARALLREPSNSTGIIVVGDANEDIGSVKVPKPFDLVQFTRAVRDVIPKGH